MTINNDFYTLIARLYDERPDNSWFYQPVIQTNYSNNDNTVTGLFTSIKIGIGSKVYTSITLGCSMFKLFIIKIYDSVDS